jgi:hypothetical protein
LGVFLRGASLGDKVERVSFEELEEALGDQLIPLQNDQNHYSMCFI